MAELAKGPVLKPAVKWHRHRRVVFCNHGAEMFLFLDMGAVIFPGRGAAGIVITDRSQNTLPSL